MSGADQAPSDATPTRRNVAAPPGAARLDAMLVDWRLLLGLGPSDQVLCVGTGAERVRRMLTPWVGRQVPDGLGPAPLQGSMDWVICGDPLHIEPGTPRGDTWRAHAESLRQVLTFVRPGGHVALRVRNRWGLHGMLGARRRASQESYAERDRTYSLRRWRALMREAGAVDVRAYALLPHLDAPRVVLPVYPACPASAQQSVIDQVWKRPTRLGMLGRIGLGMLARLRVMPHLYPYYLLVGRKPC